MTVVDIFKMLNTGSLSNRSRARANRYSSRLLYEKKKITKAMDTYKAHKKCCVYICFRGCCVV